MSSEDNQQLMFAREVQGFIKAMQQAAAQQQWHQLRSLDSELVVLLQRLELAQFRDLAPRLKPLLIGHYQKLLTQLEQEQAHIKQKMDQHLRDQEGIKAYQTSLDGN
ncbi:hypothetical protein L9G74_02810 [Shewanella sp. C32]|uniref:Flagellar protein FliT n=1 Tax=Shewanella electrica TaxID=515560 RepID=A0ABT2FI82_9GAMM|nr:hypothetical protein [Shewanella electrica]MCH1923263.1 hypothetical protein [Shewanella electrica]MCS4555360.1 hypothetical protein [Shewanella electrica]